MTPNLLRISQNPMNIPKQQWFPGFRKSHSSLKRPVSPDFKGRAVCFECKKTLVALVVFLVPLRIFASVDIIADMPSGTYHAPVYITLTPTESGSKTFYSFKPDGYPMDAFLYTGAILLKHSSPLIYFSIISPTNESKIKQNDYVIEYSPDVRFETDSVSGSGKVEVVLMNGGSGEVNVGFWQVQSESDTIVIPEGTVIAP